MNLIFNNVEYLKKTIRLFFHYHEFNIQVDKNKVAFYKSDGINMTITYLDEKSYRMEEPYEEIKGAQFKQNEFFSVLNCFDGTIILSFDKDFATLTIKTTGETIIKKEFKLRMLDINEIEAKLRELNYTEDYYIYKMKSSDFMEILKTPDRKEEKILFDIDGKKLNSTSQQESNFLLQYFSSIDKSEKLSIETIGNPTPFKILFSKKMIDDFLGGFSGLINLKIFFKESFPIIIKSDVFEGVIPIFKVVYFLAPRVDFD